MIHPLLSAQPHWLTLMTQTVGIDTTGFPPGYFVIRSVATDRLLDVTMDDIEDGTEIGLWPEKEKSLVESQFQLYLLWWFNSLINLVVKPETGFRDPETNNQVSMSQWTLKITVNPERLNSGIGQVFFIDTSGALCSRSAGHAIDVESKRANCILSSQRELISLPLGLYQTSV